MNKNISPLTFIDKLVKKNELGQPFSLMHHQREILRLAFAFDENGRLPYDTIVYSCVKKSGKDDLERRYYPCLGLHPRGAERNPYLGEWP